MEKERKFKTIGIIAVIVAIIGLSVAFAALSQTLTINGSAKNLSSSWSIVWEEIDNQTIVPSSGVGVQTGYPKLDNVSLVKDNTTQITGVNLDLGEITLHKPGDNATFRINIANKGDINAKITGVTGVSVNNTYVDYSVKYLDTNTNVTTDLIGRLLEPEERKLVIIEVKFKDVTTQEYSQIPSEGITVSLNGVSITYTQDDGTGVPDPEVQGYSFTLNELTTLSNFSVSDSIIVADASYFWTLIGEDLSENSDYYSDYGVKIFSLSINNQDLKGLETYDDLSASPGDKLYLIALDINNNDVEITIVGNNNGVWDLNSPVLNTNDDVQDFIRDYGNVPIYFIPTPEGD